jgi:hypothetical protein
MSLDPAALFFSVVISGMGLAFFVYGKKQQRWPQLVAGLALMAYPYFVGGTTALLVIGAAVGVALWLALRLGW